MTVVGTLTGVNHAWFDSTPGGSTINYARFDHVFTGGMSNVRAGIDVISNTYKTGDMKCIDNKVGSAGTLDDLVADY